MNFSLKTMYNSKKSYSLISIRVFRIIMIQMTPTNKVTRTKIIITISIEIIVIIIKIIAQNLMEVIKKISIFIKIINNIAIIYKILSKKCTILLENQFKWTETIKVIDLLILSKKD